MIHNNDDNLDIPEFVRRKPDPNSNVKLSYVAPKNRYIYTPSESMAMIEERTDPAAMLFKRYRDMIVNEKKQSQEAAQAAREAAKAKQLEELLATPLPKNGVEDQFLEAVKQSGGRIGPAALRNKLGWNTDLYHGVKDTLVQYQKIQLGRGGVVTLKESS